MSFDLAPLISEEFRELTSAEQNEAKAAAAKAAVGLVESGMTLGLGTGSTVAYFLEGLAKRVRDEGLSICGVPTSRATEALAHQYGIPLLGRRDEFPKLANDMCIDGADRVDAHGQLIKGGGAALLREKMIACHSQRLCILVDATKLEPVLSDRFALPVECLSFGIESTIDLLVSQGCSATLRRKDGAMVMTDNGHCVVDCVFASIPDPVSVQSRLLALPGVIEVGLFVDMMSTLILGRPDGTVRFAEKSSGKKS